MERRSKTIDHYVMASQTSTSSNLVAQSVDIDGDGKTGLLHGCSFSPDGLCVLTNSVGDSQLRLYNTPEAVFGPVDSTSHQDKDENSSEITEPSCPETSVVGTHLHHWKTVLAASGGYTVRCYTWYPSMISSDPASCCFVAAARDQPVHLYDAYSGAVRATYRPFNALDEMESASVVEFSNDGQKLLCAGFRSDRTIHLFDTAIPGRDSTVLRLGKTRRSSDGQKGLVSAACFSGNGPGSPVFVVGTYSPGSIYVYDWREGTQASGTILNGLCVVGHGKSHSRKKRRFVCLQSQDSKNSDNDEGESMDDANENWFSAAKVKWFQSKAQSGITQLKFAPNHEYILYSASRRSNTVIGWDLRMLSGNEAYQSNPIRGLATYETRSDTNQRLEFDIDKSGTMLFTGCQDNCVRIYDLSTGKLVQRIEALDDAANGVSYAYVNDRSLLAIATGSRKFPSDIVADDEDDPPLLTPSSICSSSLSLYDVTGCCSA